MNAVEFLKQARAEISNDPKSRIPKTVQAIVNDADVLYDIHMHVFDKNYTSKNYILLRLLEAIDNKRLRLELIEKFYKKLDDIDFRELFKIMDFNSMKEVLDYYYTWFCYQKKMITTPLTMDMRGWIMKPRKTMVMQINEMKRLMDEYPILPFLATDPHSITEPGIANLYSMFLRAFTGSNNFFGVKIYPALGYLPSHPALMPIYEICVEKKIPVTTHCGGNIIRAKKTKVTLPGYQIVNNNVTAYDVIPPKRPAEFAGFLNNPALWEPVLKTFPNLKLNLGHFGGVEIWEHNNPTDSQNRFETISRFLNNYPNVYADFSYNLADTQTIPKFLNTLNTQAKFRDKAMFGSDYWVVLAEGGAKPDQAYFVNELAKLGLKDALMKKNPEAFLFGI